MVPSLSCRYAKYVISPPIRSFVPGHKISVLATSRLLCASDDASPSGDVPARVVKLAPNGAVRSIMSVRLLRELRAARNMCQKSDRVKSSTRRRPDYVSRAVQSGREFL